MNFIKAKNKLPNQQQRQEKKEPPTTPAGKPIPPKQRKIALLGSRSVGKSSLSVQFVDEHFVESYYPTIEHTFTKTLEIDGKSFSLELLDTAGHDEFTILDSRQAIGLDGWALVYSINSRSSFDMVSIIRDKILGFTGSDHVPMVLIGNKSDLESQRQISTEEGQALAKQWNCGFTEASARSGENVLKIFLLAIIEVEKDLNPHECISQQFEDELLNSRNGDNKNVPNPNSGNPTESSDDRNPNKCLIT